MKNGENLPRTTVRGRFFGLTLCNDANGYIASTECAAHGCYGYDSRSFGSIGTAEELVTDYLGLLDTLYATR